MTLYVQFDLSYKPIPEYRYSFFLFEEKCNIFLSVYLAVISVSSLYLDLSCSRFHSPFYAVALAEADGRPMWTLLINATSVRV